MARPKNPKRDEAFKIWLNSNGSKKLKDIATELEVSDSQIRKWKNQDNWEAALNSNVTKPEGNVTKRGAPIGNKNAIGNNGGTAPKGNRNAITHGLYETVVVESLSKEEQRLFYLAAEMSGLEQELQIARFKVARLIKQQKEQTAKGTAILKDGVLTYKLQDDFYENSIMKGIELVANIEGKINKLRIEEEKLKIAKERLVMDKTKVGGDEDEFEDDGFMEALDTKTLEVWKDE